MCHRTLLSQLNRFSLMFTLFKLRHVAGTAPQLVDQTPNKLPTQAENIVTFKRDQQETLLNS